MVQLAGQVKFTGTPDNDVVSGTSFGDYLFGGEGNDNLSGLGGPDIVRGSEGNDSLGGGDGHDGIDGGGGDDQLFGEIGNDNLRAGGGRDLLDGGDGNDVLSGGVGQDRLIGGPGADVFMFDRIAASLALAPEHIVDFAPEDRIDLSSIDAASARGGQNFVFIGGSAFTGEGQIRFSPIDSATLVEVNTSGLSDADMAFVLENGAGVTDANFILTGNPNNDVPSDDVVFGDGGNIIDPTISVPSADVLFGGPGEDYMNGGAMNDEVHGGADNDIVRGDQGNDALSGDEGHDIVDGYPGNDLLFGGAGNDILRGQEGNDTLDGGSGDDALDGGSGNDLLNGGLGGDLLEGGTGSDTFMFSNDHSGLDTILDFGGADEVRLDGLLRGFNASGDTVEQFVRFVPVASNAGVLQIDADGASGAVGWGDLALVHSDSGLDARSLFQSGRLDVDNIRAPSAPVDALSYVASYDDLIRALGANAAAGEQHYRDFGEVEGRKVTFNGLQYIASYGDLIHAFGSNAPAGAAHFINSGFAEGRERDGFNEIQYIANYADLQAAFGSDYAAATQHFITNGFAEGRTDFVL